MVNNVGLLLCWVNDVGLMMVNIMVNILVKPLSWKSRCANKTFFVLASQVPGVSERQKHFGFIEEKISHFQ